MSPTRARPWPARSTCSPAITSNGSGQFEYLERATAKLKIVVPVTLLIIFVLLYLNFGRITETLIVMASVPFALVGGIWLMDLMGFNMSVAVAVGFIALAGVAAETGVVMLIYLDHAYEEMRMRRMSEGLPMTATDLREAIMTGAVERVRPEDDDCDRHHGRAGAHHVEHRHRVRTDAADRGAHDRRHVLVDRADADRDSGSLWSGQGVAPFCGVT